MIRDLVLLDSCIVLLELGNQPKDLDRSMLVFSIKLLCSIPSINQRYIFVQVPQV